METFQLRGQPWSHMGGHGPQVAGSLHRESEGERWSLPDDAEW